MTNSHDTDERRREAELRELERQCDRNWSRFRRFARGVER